MDNLPRGDKDITLLNVAYLKRFGTEVFKNGAQLEDIRNIFVKPSEAKHKNYNYMENLDLTKLPKHSII